MNNQYYFFWKNKLSNWTPSEFIVNNITYNCGEQYMMHQKALYFNDLETASEIMNETNPKIIKDLGRKVKNYNDSKWNAARYDIVKAGLYQRFHQNTELKEFLTSKKNYILVEASPFDRIWGIGYDAEHAIENINNWGENLLGKILTELANEL